MLVLDECHGARKRHPYVRIMSFYNAIPEGVQRPKIFGMTASPTPEVCMYAYTSISQCLYATVYVFSSIQMNLVLLYVHIHPLFDVHEIRY